jgi:hypothetical protein
MLGGPCGIPDTDNAEVRMSPRPDVVCPCHLKEPFRDLCGSSLQDIDEPVKQELGDRRCEQKEQQRELGRAKRSSTVKQDKTAHKKRHAGKGRERCEIIRTKPDLKQPGHSIQRQTTAKNYHPEKRRDSGGFTYCFPVLVKKIGRHKRDQDDVGVIIAPVSGAHEVTKRVPGHQKGDRSGSGQREVAKRRPREGAAIASCVLAVAGHWLLGANS